MENKKTKKGTSMSKLNFKVDETKCIHCGLCEKDCSPKIIKLNAQQIPEINPSEEEHCMKCQHCLAICPVGAISILGKDPADSTECNNFPKHGELLNLIQSRKSFRDYVQENLDSDRLEKLKSMLKYAPTGRNIHKLHFSIIDDIEVMQKFRTMTYDKIKKVLASPCGNLISKKFGRYKKAIENGNDLLFRGAPHLIVVSAPPEESCADQDGVIALSYLELYAQSLGVGTVWCGLVQACLKAFPELCEFLEIPEGHRPIYVMLFGPTKLRYSRTVQPNEYNIVSVKGNKSIDSISFISKIKRHFWNNKKI
ncbi:nitroreductase family protein [bacterium]|nr:nitroreductase family protein [bacterium]